MSWHVADMARIGAERTKPIGRGHRAFRRGRHFQQMNVEKNQLASLFQEQLELVQKQAQLQTQEVKHQAQQTLRLLKRHYDCPRQPDDRRNDISTT